MDALKVISLHVRPTFKHPFPQCLVHGLLLPAQLQGQGAESSGCCCPFPQQLLCPQPRQHHPLSGLLCASDLGWPRKICKENEMGPSSPNQHHYLRGEAFCTLLPFAHNKGERFWKSRAWAAVRYLKVMTNIWKFVLQGLTHLYKFWVRLPGVSPVASKELYLFTLAKNLALYFLICPHLSPPPEALVLPGLFFLPLTLPVLDDYYINRDSSWGWGSLPAKLVSVDLHSSMAWFPPVSEQACTYCNCCCDLLERDPLCVIHKLSGWDRNDNQTLELQKGNQHSLTWFCILLVPDAASANLSCLLLWAELLYMTLSVGDSKDSRYNQDTSRTRSFKELSTSQMC